MKKLLLSLGAVAAVVAPVASVVACGSDDNKDTNTNPGTTDPTNTDGGSKDGGSTDGGSTTTTPASKDHTIAPIDTTSTKTVLEIEAAVKAFDGTETPVERKTALGTKVLIDGPKAGTYTFSVFTGKLVLTGTSNGGTYTYTYNITPADTGADTTDATKALALQNDKDALKDIVDQYATNTKKDALNTSIDGITTDAEFTAFVATTDFTAVLDAKKLAEKAPTVPANGHQ